MWISGIGFGGIDMNKAIAASFAFVALALVALHVVPAAPTFELRHEVAGNIYIVDFNLTSDDCQAALAALNQGAFFCVPSVS
jgi:hypothetical protein